MVAGLYGDDRVGRITLCTRRTGYRRQTWGLFITWRLHRSNSRYRRGERCAPEGLCLLYGDATPDLECRPHGG